MALEKGGRLNEIELAKKSEIVIARRGLINQNLSRNKCSEERWALSAEDEIINKWSEN